MFAPDDVVMFCWLGSCWLGCMYLDYIIDTINVITDTGKVMMQRWSSRLVDGLRTLFRRGALFAMTAIASVFLAFSPLATPTASAQFPGLSFGSNSCAIETVGWVICPTIRTIARMADKGFAYIKKESMKLNFELFSNTGKTYKAWQIIQGIANVLFIVVLLYMVYNYLIGRTEGVYNLKRLLPRIIIIVILVNVSYYLGVLLIDGTNIVGDGVWNFMNDLYKDTNRVLPLGGSPDPMGDGNLTKIAATVVGSTSMVWVLLPVVAAVTITIAVISGAAVILLVMREALVATLLLASPLIFLFYLLPNLERFSGQAIRLYIQLLMLYPILALLMGTGQIVSLATGSWNGPILTYGGGSYYVLPDLISAAAAAIPLLGVWFIFKNMSSIMSAAGTRLSATIAGQRGSKDGEKARVTGNAVAGAAANKNPSTVLGTLNRRQAFSRNRRQSSLSGSVRTDDIHSSSIPKSQPGVALSNTLNPFDTTVNNDNRNISSSSSSVNNSSNSISDSNSISNEDITSQINNQSAKNQLTNNLQSTQLDADADQKQGLGDSITQAILGAKGREKDKDEKSVTAKDLFNNMNRSHESKDKDRKFSAGPEGNGGGGNTNASAGSAQPSAPVASYRAPEIAQGSNVVTGSAAGSAPVQIVAVPAQVSSAELMGGQSNPPDNMAQPPISGTEEKAKARAQKYLFNTEQDLEDARNRQDILGKKVEKPTEQPHIRVGNDEKDKE